VGTVRRFVSLVIDQGASFRCAAGALDLLDPATVPAESSPGWTTGRTWLMRLGLAALVRPKDIADDWVWMVDHSIQIGQCKCLVILGTRLDAFAIARPLGHRDMELIDLVPMYGADKRAVAACLEAAVAKTGAPRAILSDGAADLHGGIETFRARHPEAVEIYDIKHKAACLLKARLADDKRWARYASLSGQAKFATQQTASAALVPPSQRSKARFMNLGELVRWGERTLALLDDPSALRGLPIPAEPVQSKLGWLAEFRGALSEWSADHEVIAGALDFVRSRGLYRGAGSDLAAAIPAPAAASAAGLRRELIAFVEAESAAARAGEVLPGTTEVLESCFGKLKAVEAGQSKSGFTGLVLSLGAMVSTWSAEAIGEALERCRVRDVWAWCRERLGVSVQALRRRAYGGSRCATNPG
jgi:hypothetical protein